MNENQARYCAEINMSEANEPGCAPPSVTTHFALILRIWRDATGAIWGQVVEPLEDRRTPFRGRDELWRLLEERIQPSTDAAQGQ